MSKALMTTGTIVAGFAVTLGVWAALAKDPDGKPNPSESLPASATSDPAPIQPTINLAAPSTPRASKGLAYTDLASGNSGKSKDWSEEDKRRFKELQAKHDLDGDGKLNDEEKAAMWEEIKQHFAAERIAKFDLDGDGVLNEEEERAARLSDLLGSDYGQSLARKYDLNRDGVLNDAEIAALETGLAQLKQNAVDKHDLDGDGGLDDLESEIAKESYQYRIEAMKDSYSQRFDADADGKLSPSEQAAAWQAFGALYQQQRFVMGNDSNGDGVVNNTDMGDFIDRFSDKDPTADLNNDGTFNTADFDEFNRRIDEGENTMPEGDELMPDAWFVESIKDETDEPKED